MPRIFENVSSFINERITIFCINKRKYIEKTFYPNNM